MSKVPQIVDARGLRCPWPALRLARAVREGARDVELLSDDPAAAAEIAALATTSGWQVAAAPGGFRVTVAG